MQTILILLISLLTQPVEAQWTNQNEHDKILGIWANEDQTRTLEFVKNGDSYDAIIRHEADENLIGKKQITSLKAAGKNAYNNGTLYIIKRDQTVDCSARLIDYNTLELKASFGLISRKQNWVRK